MTPNTGHTIEVHLDLSAMPEPVALDFILALDTLVQAHPDDELITVTKTGHGATYAAPDGTPRRVLRLFHPTERRLAACDGRCNFVWGDEQRPQHQRSEHPDDWEWLADSELSTVPKAEEWVTGSPPAQDGPLTDKLNTTFCLKYCERCIRAPDEASIALRDFSHRLRNIPAPKDMKP